jgi:D-aminoacyl-tRNA deacylase
MYQPTDLPAGAPTKKPTDLPVGSKKTDLFLELCVIMRAAIQRVTKASVSINGSLRSRIGKGLLILLGIEEADNQEDIEWLSGKICRLRIFDDPGGVMNLSVSEINGEILVVSQFTLHASTKKGNRPSYIRAARPETAIPIYERFVQQLTNNLGKEVKTGEFGAMMQIQLINDGPVTIVIDSKARE